MGVARSLRVVVAASTIAACFTYVHYSTSEHHAVVHPTAVPFGNVQIGQVSPRLITISPAGGEQSDIVQSIIEQAPGCPNFSLAFPFGMPPAPVTSTCNGGSGSGSGGSGSGGGCDSFSTTSFTFQANFAPTIQTAQTCVLVLMISGNASTITLTGTGVPPPIDIKLETGDAAQTARCSNCVLDFGQTNVGLDATPQVVKVVNDGSGNADLKSVTTTAPFTVVSGNPRTLGASDSQAFSITCHPTAVGAVTGVLTIASDDPDSPTQNVTLKCIGVTSNLSPDPNTLGMQTRVHEPKTLRLDLHNLGGAGMTITSLAFDPPAGFSISGVAVGTPIGPGGNAVTFVTYTPDAAVATNPLATLTIGFDNTETRIVTINGPVVETTFSLTPTGPPSTADLGAVCLGATKTQPFSLTATSDGDFELQNLQIVLGSQFYTIVPTNPPSFPTVGVPHTVIGLGQSAVEFEIAVTPTMVGALPGGFTMSTDIPDTAPLGIGLMATGLPSGPNVTPQGPIDFGTVKVGEVSTEPALITFTNCSESTVSIMGAGIVGDPDFVIKTRPDAEVAANASATFEIVLTPLFGGVKLGSLEIQHPDGISAVSFIGNGDGPLETEPGDPRDTYYRCSAGNATGASPLLLALLLVLRRRRATPKVG